MRIAKLKVQNYRGLRDIEIPVSNFGCLIGENNAGKSSVLQALSLFFSGSSLSHHDYFDQTAEIRIQATLTNITENDLSRLSESHQPKVAGIINNSTLTLVRVYGSDGKSKLKYRKLIPTDERFAPETVDAFLKGKRASASFCTDVLDLFPELANQMMASTSQTAVRGLIERLSESLPEEQKTWLDADLPTGIEAAFKPLFPEVIYIPAVKDLSDDVKTKESATFGKVLGILLKAIESQLDEAIVLFQNLNAKLNRTQAEDGQLVDERLPEVRIIEETVERFLRESFSYVQLNIKIPPPDLKTILSSAQILINDGVEGTIDTKGDGLRRATVFAILRSYLELNQRSDSLTERPSEIPKQQYLLLFEEPELYLHPTAQQILFSALSVFAKSHTVFVTTHSPIFCGPDSTATFIKLAKRFDEETASKPFTVSHPIDLGDMNARDQFQLICYENNNAAFFANTVVLVEGDSDYLVFPHLARIISPEWNWMQTSVRFARIHGKTSIRRYRDFFARFQARVVVIADLDLLVQSFEQVNPAQSIVEKRNALLEAIDQVIDADSNSSPNLSGKKLRKLQERGDAKALWQQAKTKYDGYRVGDTSFEELSEAVDTFFAVERYDLRLSILEEPPTPEITRLKHELLCALRQVDIYVLERGAIEAYYPESVHGADKPSKAQIFCNTITCREDALALCSNELLMDNNEYGNEFDILFSSIFDQAQIITRN